MRKKILFLFILFISFIFIKNVSARMCYYDKIYESFIDRNKENSIQTYEASNKPSAKFQIKGNSSKSNKVSVDYINNKGRNATYNIPIENWVKPYGNTSTVGSSYDNNASQSCPSYFLYAGYNGDFSAYIAKDQNEFSTIKDYYLIHGRHADPGEINGYKLIETKEKSIISTSSCLDYNDENNCESNKDFSCMWVTKNGKSYCNFDDLTYVKCGDAWDIPTQLPSIISFLINLLKIATPIILVFVSVISLIKAVAASKEDDIKKAQGKLVKRIIAAVLVFFVIQITQFIIITVADDSEEGNIESCLSCFINNDCSKNIYYKTNVGGTYVCTSLNGSKFEGECH